MTLRAVPDLAEPVDDFELVRRLRTGDSTAFEPLMRRHNQRLFRTARSIVKSEEEAEITPAGGAVRAVHPVTTPRPLKSL